MRRLLAGALLAGAMGCATPYQEMGLRGGYSDAVVGPNRFSIDVHVNGFTSAGTALQYAYQRAGELCTAGYDVIDGAKSQSTSFVVGRGYVSEIDKPEVSLIIQCSAPPPPMAPESPPVVGTAALWCTDGPAVKVCFSSAQRCESYRADRLQHGAAPAACAEREQGACFTLRLARYQRATCAVLYQ